MTKKRIASLGTKSEYVGGDFNASSYYQTITQDEQKNLNLVTVYNTFVTQAHNVLVSLDMFQSAGTWKAEFLPG